KGPSSPKGGHRVLGPLDYAIWLTGFSLEVALLLRILYRRAFSRYYAIAAYVAGDVFAQCLEYLCISRYGVDSKQFHFYYYYVESLLTILLFFVIIHFYQQIFAELNVNRYISGGASILLVATALFSYLVVRQHESHLTSAFVVELGQDLYFVGVVLTYMLWGAILKLRETRTRLIQLVLALGIYFSATAGVYALRNLFPEMGTGIFQLLAPAIGAWLPLAWVYTFFRVPEDARLTTAGLVVTVR
ncbi:MAG: hypothetical protein ACM3JD_00725, partial [Rudaea sp.]